MRILSVNFWVQAFVSAFITMVCFYVLKKINQKVEIPVVNEVIEQA